jgi:hypothetical protein
MKRPGEPAELATAYVMLADPLSSYVSGAGDWRKTDPVSRSSIVQAIKKTASKMGQRSLINAS